MMKSNLGWPGVTLAALVIMTVVASADDPVCGLEHNAPPHDFEGGKLIFVPYTGDPFILNSTIWFTVPTNNVIEYSMYNGSDVVRRVNMTNSGGKDYYNNTIKLNDPPFPTLLPRFNYTVSYIWTEKMGCDIRGVLRFTDTKVYNLTVNVTDWCGPETTCPLPDPLDYRRITFRAEVNTTGNVYNMEHVLNVTRGAGSQDVFTYRYSAQPSAFEFVEVTPQSWVVYVYHNVSSSELDDPKINLEPRDDYTATYRVYNGSDLVGIDSEDFDIRECNVTRVNASPMTGKFFNASSYCVGDTVQFTGFVWNYGNVQLSTFVNASVNLSSTVYSNTSANANLLVSDGRSMFNLFYTGGWTPGFYTLYNATTSAAYNNICPADWYTYGFLLNSSTRADLSVNTTNQTYNKTDIVELNHPAGYFIRNEGSANIVANLSLMVFNDTNGNGILDDGDTIVINGTNNTGIDIAPGGNISLANITLNWAAYAYGDYFAVLAVVKGNMSENDTFQNLTDMLYAPDLNNNCNMHDGWYEYYPFYVTALSARLDALDLDDGPACQQVTLTGNVTNTGYEPITPYVEAVCTFNETENRTGTYTNSSPTASGESSGFTITFSNVNWTSAGSDYEVNCSVFAYNGTAKILLFDTGNVKENLSVEKCPICGDGYADPGEECGEGNLTCSADKVCISCVCITPHSGGGGGGSSGGGGGGPPENDNGGGGGGGGGGDMGPRLMLSPCDYENFAVLVEPGPHVIKQGGSKEIKVTISNNGPLNEQCYIRVTLETESDNVKSSISPVQMVVPQGESHDATLKVTAPKDFEGKDTVTVIVTKGDEKRTAATQVEVIRGAMDCDAIRITELRVYDRVSGELVQRWRLMKDGKACDEDQICRGECVWTLVEGVEAPPVDNPYDVEVIAVNFDGVEHELNLDLEFPAFGVGPKLAPPGGEVEWKLKVERESDLEDVKHVKLTSDGEAVDEKTYTVRGPETGPTGFVGLGVVSCLALALVPLILLLLLLVWASKKTESSEKIERNIVKLGAGLIALELVLIALLPYLTTGVICFDVFFWLPALIMAIILYLYLRRKGLMKSEGKRGGLGSDDFGGGFRKLDHDEVGGKKFEVDGGERLGMSGFYSPSSGETVSPLSDAQRDREATHREIDDIIERVKRKHAGEGL